MLPVQLKRLRFPIRRRVPSQDQDLEIPYENHGYPQDRVEEVVDENSMELKPEPPLQTLLFLWRMLCRWRLGIS